MERIYKILGLLKIESLSLRRLYVFFWSLISVELVITIFKVVLNTIKYSYLLKLFLILCGITLVMIISGHVKEKKWTIFIKHFVIFCLLCLLMIFAHFVINYGCPREYCTMGLVEK